MCLLLFDIKVSLSGDDSDYLVNAENFWRHFRYPGYHGALYSILISPFTGIFGYKLVLLKLLSCLFMLTFLWLFYKSFRGKVANSILIPTLLLVSINSYVFFYASQTYSEALFMLTQGCFFFYLFKHFIDKKEEPFHLKSDWKKYVTLSLLILAMGLTRSIGYAAIGVLILLFAINRRWKDLLYSTTAFILVFTLFQLFKSIVWPDTGASYDINSLLAKDYYNPVERESFGGLCQRFIENSQIYLSAFLYQFMGFVKMKEILNHYSDINTFRTILAYVFFTLSLIVSLKKKNNSLLSIGLYAGVMCFASFVILHSFWQQNRLIMVFYPFILLFLLGGVYYLFQTTKLRQLSFVYLIIIGGLFIGTFSTTKNRITQNIPVLQQNLLGDALYGLTPDQKNFIKASQWAAENLDKDATIMSRKPTISKIYAGREFAGSPNVIAVPIDSLFQIKNTNKQTCFISVEEKTLSGISYLSKYFKYFIANRKNFSINNQHTQSVFLYLIPNSEMEHIQQILKEQQVTYTLDYNTIVEQCKKQTADIRIYDPDLLMDYLLKNKIDYLLLPQLRVDPTQNKGKYLSHVHQFVWYISYKYENRFQSIHTVGDEEPCIIVQFIH